MAKKYYNIQLKKDGDIGPWYCPIEAQNVSREFINGYIACIKGYYPCPDIRIQNVETKDIVEEIKGNNKVKV